MAYNWPSEVFSRIKNIRKVLIIKVGPVGFEPTTKGL